MKKLLKNVISFAIIAVIASTQSAIAGDANYRIEVKNKFYDKEYTANRKGVHYTSNPIYAQEPYNIYWILNDGYHPYTTTFTANYYDPYNRTTANSRTCYVKQFAVSKGVVYWINPSENVIRYWNTVDGTTGTIAPTGTYNGVSYPFKGSDTGYGSITHDWYGNLVHAWNGYGGSSNNINTPTRGYAVYKAPTTYGTVINSAPVLSDMPTCATAHARRADKGYAWNNSNAANPNYLATENVYKGSTTMTNLNTYGMNGGGQLVGEKIAVDYISASGNLFNNVGWVDNSTYQAGYWGGQVWHTYGHIVTGNMFADGAYSNWYINYLVTTSAGYAQIPNGSYGDGLLNYSREFFFQEVGGQDGGSPWNQYYYTSPNRGFYQTSQDGKISHIPTIVYPRGSSNGLSDLSVAPDVNMLKGYKIIANILNKGTLNASSRDNAFDVNVVGGGRESGDNRIGYAYSYKETGNSNPIPYSVLNAWLEYEKVNENVLALYTYSPGQGFSKFYVTAVRKNNKVSNVSVSEIRSINNLTPQAKITWTAQPYDRETLHRYLIYYKAYTTTDATTIDNMTWQLATVDANGNPQPVDIGTATTGSFIHNTPVGIDANDKKYEITYKYLIVPIYDGSDHMGEEVETSEFKPTKPMVIVKGNLYQVTDKGGPNGETRYAFSLRLDPYFDTDAVGAKSLKQLIITSSGGWGASHKLFTASHVTFGDQVVIPQVGVEFMLQGGGAVSTHGAYSLVLNAEGLVGDDGKLPPIIWHNVNPDPAFVEDNYSKTYNLAVHAQYTEYADFRGPRNDESGQITPVQLYIPTVDLSMGDVQMQPLEGDYSHLQRDEHFPLGTQRKVGSNEVTNPVTISKANTFGTKGSAINPLLVTDEVMENWNIQYVYHIMQNGSELINPIQIPASNEVEEYYSNKEKVTADIIGLPINKTSWDVRSKLWKEYQSFVSDEENFIKQDYDITTASKNYSAKVDVVYTRKEKAAQTGEDIVVEPESATYPLVISSSMTDGSVFPELGVNRNSVISLFQRESSHYYYNNDEDNGYYPCYYDAVVNWTWPNYTNNLNKYIGFHAVTQTECVGHYVKDKDGKLSKVWVPYHSASIIPDEYIGIYNSTLKKNGIDEHLIGIGYDGTDNTDWSTLAAENKMLPMEIHYVWAGNSWLNKERVSEANFGPVLTVDYPIIEGVALKIGEFVDYGNYSMLSSSLNKASSPITMSVISKPESFSVYADNLTTVTGVEGVLTNACGGVKIYPNPVKSSFTLEAPMDMGSVKIFSTSGQLVKEINNVEASRVTIIVDDLPQGVYIVNTLGVAQIIMKM